MTRASMAMDGPASAEVRRAARLLVPLAAWHLVVRIVVGIAAWHARRRSERNAAVAPSGSSNGLPRYVEPGETEQAAAPRACRR